MTQITYCAHVTGRRTVYAPSSAQPPPAAASGIPTSSGKESVKEPRTSERLVQLFERELREFDTRDMSNRSAPPVKRTTPRVSDELTQEVVEFAYENRTSGMTPEQMLVELKTMLAMVAPDIPSSQRNALVATVTGRAIDAFFRK